ncbi:MDR family MFS transporter [Rhizobium sp. L1K21]|uniref:MDR family MFS transporter n=1 Tax=Rhizobium sp. L1K21 TaxID=2954933 RepID=UPI002091EBF5|nr:MDR family MFS transporter [Rhizobium sp. L1K21]MCO6185505.1 MFS transporter [Rhizobium sp. L1K21]
MLKTHKFKNRSFLILNYWFSMDKPVESPAAGHAFSQHESLIPDSRRRHLAFACLLIGVFMSTLDVQVIATALPTIVAEFGHIERYGWVGSAYLLGSCAVMPIYGKLGDLFGRKYVIMAAISLFLFGSLTCGLAVSMDTLILARVLQALGGGGIMVTIFSINADLFAPHERAKYQSYSSLMLMASGFVGPVLGGTLSELFGWRSIFLINLPVGIVVLTGIALLLPYKKPDRKPKIDYLGALLLACAITSIVLWADGAEVLGGLLSPAGLLVIASALVFGILWVMVEKRVEEPVVPLNLFSNATISKLLVVSATSGALGIGLVNYLAFTMQTTLGMSPMMAGLLFIPCTAGIAVGALSAGRIIFNTGRYKIFSVISMISNLLTVLLISQIGPETPIWLVALIISANGIGIGIGQQVPVVGIQNAAPFRDVGVATGTATLTRMGGASIAISVYGALIAFGLSGLSGTIPGVDNLATLTAEAKAALPAHTQDMIAAAYHSATQPLYFAAAGLALIGLIAALSLKDIQMPVRK